MVRRRTTLRFTVLGVSAVLALAALGTRALAAQGAVPIFDAPPIPIDSPGASIASADLNGDGLDDLVVANHTVNTVSTLLARGGASFAPKHDFPAGLAPKFPAIADVDLDGRLDVVVANTGSASLSVFPGDGFGGLGAKHDVALTGAPTQLLLAELNADGKIDAVVQIAAASVPTVCLGDGAGGFTPGPPASPPTPPFGALAVRADGDVNGDGVIDVVGTTSWVFSFFAPQLVVYVNGGTASLGAPHLTTIGYHIPTTNNPNPTSLATSDFNADGHGDFAIGFGNTSLFAPTGGILAFLGDGGGGVTGSSLSLSTEFTNPMVTATPDLNGDGRPDLVSVSQNLGFPNYELFLSGPGPVPSLAGATSGSFSDFVAIGDFDGDGDSDVAVTTLPNWNGPPPSVQILLNTFPSGPTTISPTLSLPAGVGAQSIRTADLDGDGTLDLLVANLNAGTLSVLRGAPAGGFAPAAAFGTFAVPSDLAIGDVDLDGRLDVAVGSATLPMVSVVLGPIGGGATSPNPVATGGSTAIRVALADLDGDGLLDLVSSNGVAGLSLSRGLGGGAFAPFSSLSVGGNATQVRGVDVNEDGAPDLVTAVLSPDGIAVRLGNGAGGFGALATFALPFSSTQFAMGDWNEDRHLDLAASNATHTGFPAAIAVLQGDGAGTFALASTLDAIDLNDDVVAADMNGDGHLDLVLALDVGSPFNAFSVYRGDGSGAFTAAVPELSSLGGFARIAVADLNGDGRLDVAGTRSDAAIVAFNATPYPDGVSTFGIGTHGCAGPHGVNATGSAHVGQDLQVLCTNAPANALGLAIESDASDVPGTDFLALGVLFHVDFVAATYLNAWDLHSDAAGNAKGVESVPNVPAFVGTQHFIQCFWGWPACAPPSPFHLSSSKGLIVTFQ